MKPFGSVLVLIVSLLLPQFAVVFSGEPLPNPPLPPWYPLGAWQIESFFGVRETIGPPPNSTNITSLSIVLVNPNRVPAVELGKGDYIYYDASVGICWVQWNDLGLPYKSPCGKRHVGSISVSEWDVEIRSTGTKPSYYIDFTVSLSDTTLFL
ncbi:hypothetical protein GGS23DRAFT_422750 [Durotheca rogersii]|uniref:uncharacterized protein n=1 Tax=Durotheca rogersii TaxID=419775 RepID=UPI00221F5280|nr:uncharacterized protein GGS23DRAFT_422750 [Durotheca rogersii]KAI5865355.1 hypothetical protein GGS23DRAFT_422750 [Durotheca rogersii]